LTFSGTLSLKSGWQTLLVGELARVEVQATNSGTQPWLAGDMQVVIEPEGWGDEKIFSLPEGLGPGEDQRFIWVTGPLSASGVYQARAYLRHGERALPGEPVDIRLVVLPEELKDRRGELDNKIALLSVDESDQINQLVSEWIRDQEPPQTANFLAVLLVSVMILPTDSVVLIFRNR
jgi:hypothetical protein